MDHTVASMYEIKFMCSYLRPILVVSSEITTLVIAVAYKNSCMVCMAIARKLGELHEQRYDNRSNRTET